MNGEVDNVGLFIFSFILVRTRLDPDPWTYTPRQKEQSGYACAGNKGGNSYTHAIPFVINYYPSFFFFLAVMNKLINERTTLGCAMV